MLNAINLLFLNINQYLKNALNKFELYKNVVLYDSNQGFNEFLISKGLHKERKQDAKVSVCSN